MRLFRLLVQKGDPRLQQRARRRRVAATVLRGQESRSCPDHLPSAVGVDAARQAHHQVRQAVVISDVVDQVVAHQPRHGFDGAADVPAERMLRPHHLLEKAVHVVLREILVHLQLFQDHLALVVDVARSELRLGDDVEKHVDAELQVVGWDPRPVAGQLFVRRCIEHPADTLDRLGDFFGRRTPLGALEKEVLDEMGGAAPAVILISRADPEHQDQAGRLAVAHRGGDQTGAAL